MQKIEEKSPALIIEYTDPEEGFQGWLVIDTLDHNLCAGGMRVQPGLSKERLARMARNMTCKMRICGLRVDGAKSGIDYDPAAPGKRAAMARFMAAISPYIINRYSMGPDLNVDMAELESIARDLGLHSVKMAVAKAQGLELSRFSERYKILSQEFDGWPLGKLRVGYGVSVAVLAVLDHLGVPHKQATIALQGFGNLAKAAAFGLNRKGVRIMALADGEKCIVSENDQGLDVKQLLDTEGPLLPEKDYGSGVRMMAREEIINIPCDILIPAAVEKTITHQVAGQLQVKAVVPGANLAVTPEADSLLHQRGIVVLPDLLSGSGGSLSMEGLFAPEDNPDPAEILGHVERRMTQMVNQILARSQAGKISPAQAALQVCSEIVVAPGGKAYELKVES
jgi:glutamate dehydrogenase (NAD(P)+)